MASISHITPRYIIDRLNQMSYHRAHPGSPWLTAPMIDILDQWLHTSDRGLEWGSGRSTPWFADRVTHLTSIEEDLRWGQRVDAMLIERGLRGRVDLRVVPIDPNDRSAGSPYVLAGNALAPESVDFALIDGDLRDHCALAALSLLKPGGILIIDNVERYLSRKRRTRSPNSRPEGEGPASATWERVHNEISTWRSVWTSDGVSDTAMWVKP